MSATEELRRLLDERGAEWQAPNNCQRDEITQFRVGGDFGGTWWEAYETGDGTFQMSSEIYDELTPEQAIVATLGRGECEMEYVSDFMSWHCKACDMMDMAPHNPKPRYCKWCGAKVVE